MKEKVTPVVKMFQSLNFGTDEVNYLSTYLKDLLQNKTEEEIYIEN